MVHYVAITTPDLERSASFYDALLGPLGWRRHVEDPSAIAWGLVRSAIVVTRGEAAGGNFGVVSLPAKSIPAVKASFESGLKNGGKVEAEPGASPAFGNGNYAARLRDPDGYTVEICVAFD